MKKKAQILVQILVLLALVSGCSSNRKANDTVYAGPGVEAVLNGISFSIRQMETRREVKPEKPSGYYHYYEELKDWNYYVITGQAANRGTYELHTENLTVNGIHGKKSYEGRLLFSNPEKSEFMNEIKVDEELEFYFILLVKNGDPLPDKIEIYCMKDFSVPQKRKQYDELFAWTLPPA